MVKGHQRRKCILLKVKLRGRPTVAVIKRWPTNTGPNTCYGDFGAHSSGCIIEGGLLIG